jgi:hypothetical protein
VYNSQPQGFSLGRANDKSRLVVSDNRGVPITPIAHTPVAAGPAYADRIQRLHSKFTATLKPEPDNRFNHAAVAVLAGGEKIGYLPPEISRHYFETLLAASSPVECPGRRAPLSAHENTGVDILLDLTGVACAS